MIWGWFYTYFFLFLRTVQHFCPGMLRTTSSRWRPFTLMPPITEQVCALGNRIAQSIRWTRSNRVGGTFTGAFGRGHSSMMVGTAIAGVGGLSSAQGAGKDNVFPPATMFDFFGTSPTRPAWAIVLSLGCALSSSRLPSSGSELSNADSAFFDDNNAIIFELIFAKRLQPCNSVTNLP
jgi:hypothetical protein